MNEDRVVFANTQQIVNLPEKTTNDIKSNMQVGGQKLIDLLSYIFGPTPCEEVCELGGSEEQEGETGNEEDESEEKEDRGRGRSRDRDEDEDEDEGEGEEEEDRGRGRSRDRDEDEDEDEGEGEGEEEEEEVDQELAPPERLPVDEDNNPDGFITQIEDINDEFEREVRRNITGTPENVLTILNDLLGAEDITSACLYGAFLKSFKKMGLPSTVSEYSKESTIINENTIGIVSRTQALTQAIRVDESKIESQKEIQDIDDDSDLTSIITTAVRAHKVPFYREADFVPVTLIGLDTSGSMSSYIINEANRYLGGRTANNELNDRLINYIRNTASSGGIEHYFYEFLRENYSEKLQDFYKQNDNDRKNPSEWLKSIYELMKKMKEDMHVNSEKFVGKLCGGVYGNIDFVKEYTPYFNSIIHASELSNYAAASVGPVWDPDTESASLNPDGVRGIHFIKAISYLQGAGNDNLYEVGRMFGITAKRIILSTLLTELFYKYGKDFFEQNIKEIYIAKDFIFNTIHVTDLQYNLEESFIKGFFDELFGMIEHNERFSDMPIGKFKIIDNLDSISIERNAEAYAHYIFTGREQEAARTTEELKRFLKYHMQKINAFKILYNPKAGVFYYTFMGKIIGYGYAGLSNCIFFVANFLDKSAKAFNTERSYISSTMIDDVINKCTAKEQDENTELDTATKKDIVFKLLPSKIIYHNLTLERIKNAIIVVKLSMLKAALQNVKESVAGYSMAEILNMAIQEIRNIVRDEGKLHSFIKEVLNQIELLFFAGESNLNSGNIACIMRDFQHATDFIIDMDNKTIIDFDSLYITASNETDISRAMANFEAKIKKKINRGSIGEFIQSSPI